MADPGEFLRLFLPIQGDLLAYVLASGVPPADAQDVLQESATVMWRKIGVFQSGTNFRAWAYAVVSREVRHALSRHRRPWVSLSEAAAADVMRLATSEQEASRFSLTALTICVEKLQAPARQILDLRYHQNLDAGEVAGRLRRPVESIYTTLSRIRKALQECLERSARREEGLA